MSHSIRSAAMVVMILGCAGLSFAQCLPVWVKMNPANSPSPRFSPSMVSYEGRVVMFGGLGPNGRNGELWTWDGTDWTLHSNVQSLARSNHAGVPIMLTAVGPPSVLFFGGVNADGTETGSLISWTQSGMLSQFAPSLPGVAARFNHVFVGAPGFNATNLLMGGGTCLGMQQDAFRIGPAPVIPVPPPASFLELYRRSNAAAFWSVPESRAVIHGGSVASSPCAAPEYSGLMFRWNALQGWVSIPNNISPARANHAGAHSSVIGSKGYRHGVIFGGETQAFPSSNGLLGDTWLGSDPYINWIQLPPGGPSPRRSVNNLAWVESQRHFVLFGGHDGGLSPEGAANQGYLGDTWILTYQPGITATNTIEVACPSGPVALESEVARASLARDSAWQFRVIDAATGSDSGWRFSENGLSCAISDQCLIDSEEYGSFSNPCTAQVTFTRGPALALADRLSFRFAAALQCDASDLVFGPAIEVSFLPDLNADNVVNTADLIAFLGRFGQTTAPGQPILLADFNGDRAVNTPDLVFLLGRFGQSCN